MTQGDTDWSRHAANFAVTALVHAKILAQSDLERAADIVAEEILARLALEDRPTADNWRYESKGTSP